MGSSTDSVNCPLCGDTNAREIPMFRNLTYVCPDPLCPHYCPEREQVIDRRRAKLLESSDELEFFFGEDICLTD